MLCPSYLSSLHCFTNTIIVISDYYYYFATPVARGGGFPGPGINKPVPQRSFQNYYFLMERRVTGVFVLGNN